jgi:hypothetical protein
VWETKFHNKTKIGKIIVLYILIVIFVYSELEEKIFCSKW